MLFVNAFSNVIHLAHLSKSESKIIIHLTKLFIVWNIRLSSFNVYIVPISIKKIL